MSFVESSINLSVIVALLMESVVQKMKFLKIIKLVIKWYIQAASDVHYELDEYYFLPLPQQLIYTHFPKDPIWQLIKSPITVEQFEKQALVKSAFFKLGLRIVSHKDAVIKAKNEVTIKIGCAPGKVVRTTLYTSF